ncbi:ATP-grasp domain-containing protein [Coleofasciculus sp.]|uniref:ATP-grasp domain-containing protein n=1 Tax=Coleofasciculus sp. TaxID=3100458 RepID=UPI0039F90C6C
MFETLNSVLQAYKLKPIKEAPVELESDESQPCIVFFTLADERLTLLLAASRILPERAFIVTEPTWLKVIQKGDKSVSYLLEGITMNEFSQCFHTKFKTPQKITFLCNFCTEAAFSFYEPVYQEKASKFQFYEGLADCPMSSGIELEEYTNDKLHTRLLAATRNVNVPQTMFFGFSLDKYSHHPVTPKVQLISLSRNLSSDKIREYLTAFPASQFVIKPSGARWMGSRLCTIESKDNLDRAVENFNKCVDSLQDNDCLLVEEFINSSITKNSKLGSRLKVFVTRRPNNVVETSGIICNLGYIDQPINGDTSESFSIDYLCNLLQLTNEDKNQLVEKINRLGEAVLESIIVYEKQYLTHISQNKQTDFIGLDVVLINHNNQLEPFLIEVNERDCISTLQLYEMQHSPNRTDILDKWIETMLYRSYQYMLKGKNILMIGGGGYSKLNIFEFANRVGINIILVDSDPQHFAVSYSSQFFNVNIDNHTKDIENALAIVEVVRKHNTPIDGVVTFWEDNVPLSSLVANFLGKPSNSYQSASIAKSKFLTHKKILAVEPSYEARGFSNGVEVFNLKDVADVYKIPQHYYPLVIKLDTGSASFGVEVIQTEEELIAKFEDYKSYIQTATQYGAGLGFNYQIFVTPYLQGSEHDVDIIMFDGELVAGYVTDNGPTVPTLCNEMTEIMPSLLDREKQENLIHSAWKACHDIGLKYGVFCVDVIYTSLGVKILEINARMGGFYVSKWQFNIRDVNLILYSYLIACRIKPFVNQSSLPRICYNGFLCYTSLHKHIIDEAKLKELSSDSNFFISILEKEIPAEEKYEVPYASVAVCSQNIAEGKQKMKRFLEEHSLTREEYRFICEE